MLSNCSLGFDPPAPSQALAYLLYFLMCLIQAVGNVGFRGWTTMAIVIHDGHLNSPSWTFCRLSRKMKR